MTSLAGTLLGILVLNNSGKGYMRDSRVGVKLRQYPTYERPAFLCYSLLTFDSIAPTVYKANDRLTCLSSVLQVEEFSAQFLRGHI